MQLSLFADYANGSLNEPLVSAQLKSSHLSGAGVGGASMRMKLAKASMSEITAGLEVAEVAGVVKLSELFGVAVKMQDGVSSRS